MNDLLPQLRRILLYLGDLAVLYGVLAVVLILRYTEQFDLNVWDEHFLPFTLIFAVWLVVFYISGLYDTRETKNDISFYMLVFRTMLINALIGVIYFYVFSERIFTIKPQVVFLVYIGIFSLAFLLWRRLYNLFIAREQFLRNVIFIGSGEDIEVLFTELARRPYLGYRVVEFVRVRGNNNTLPTPELETLDLHKLLLDRKIDIVVTSPELHGQPKIVEQIYRNLFLGIAYFDLPTFYEKILGRIPVATIGQLWFLENLTENDKKFYELFKRFGDLIFTLLLGAVGAILTPFIALAILLDFPGPVLFRQSRVGQGGRLFLAMKFRSMIMDSEKNGPQWTKADDPRVTRVGRVLRKLKLDEIPQLINILRGEMSFIGPRPEQPEFVDSRIKKVPYYNERHLVKPGLTGWAQINAPFTSASEEDTLSKLQYDLYYIKNRSMLLDLGILLKTINIVLTRQGR